MAVIKQVEGKASWIKYIEYRIKRNKNFIAGTYGPTGSGKSWTDLSISETLDSQFKEHPDRICFSPLALMKLINSGEIKRGDVIILEELGIQAGNRDWQSMFNKVIVQLLQTFRNLGIILLVNVPYEDFIDAHVRKLMHASWRTMDINYSNQSIKIKPQVIQYNDRKHKFYYKYLRIKANNKIRPIKRWNVPKPSQELVNIYEELKSKFTKKLNKELERKLQMAEDKSNSDLTPRQQQIYDLLLRDVPITEIAKQLGIINRAVYFHIGLIKKKGFEIPEISRKMGVL